MTSATPVCHKDEWLRLSGACQEAVDQLASCATLEEAWEKLDNPSWMIGALVAVSPAAFRKFVEKCKESGVDARNLTTETIRSLIGNPFANHTGNPVAKFVNPSKVERFDFRSCKHLGNSILIDINTGRPKTEECESCGGLRLVVYECSIKGETHARKCFLCHESHSGYEAK